MIQIIVFSFNRTLQLDALLSSIKQYWTNTEYQLSVLYNTSNKEYQTGYKILEENYLQYRFVKETNGNYKYSFQDYLSLFNLKKLIRYKKLRTQHSNFRNLLNQLITESNCDYIMFLTDDSIFIKDVRLSSVDLAFIDKNPKQNSISLRLGKYITTPPSDLKIDEGKIKWNFNKYRNYRSWGYNFSVDGHIYSTSIIKHLLKRIIYTNPSFLEAVICDYVKRNKFLDVCLTYEEPYLLSYPINMVQNIVTNESLNVSEAYLNQCFLNHKRLIYPIPSKINEFQQYPDYIIIEDKNGKEILRTKQS